MIEKLLQSLIDSKNEAADEVLLEALRRGAEPERQLVLRALLKREHLRGTIGIVEMFEELSPALQIETLQHVRRLYSALRECGRAEDANLRIKAMRLIAQGRQGKLAYVLTENLHDTDDQLSRAGAEALVQLAQCVSAEAIKLHKGELAYSGEGPDAFENSYRNLVDQRGEVELAIGRAIDMHRGKQGQELLRAALLLCDWPGSKTLAILQGPKHGGQSMMVRRLQQPPDAEHVKAFLLGASHGQLRSHFGVAFSHIAEAPVLDALLRQTHWLKDHQMQLCVHQVTRGTWWGDAELMHDVSRREFGDAALVAEWLAVSGMHDVTQDERIEQVRQYVKDDFPSRVRLLRIGMRRRKGQSVKLLIGMLSDPDERIVRMAAREIIRRKPIDYENTLIQLMTSAAPSVRRVIGRSVGQVGFEQFWERFDRLDRATRRQAGRAMLKLLPDAIQRLGKRLTTGPHVQRLKAMQITQELDLAEQLRPQLMTMCNDPDPKLRSKAVAALGDMSAVPPEVLLDRVLADSDARVRANAIEVLEAKNKTDYVSLLTQRARSGRNRERANAIKAMHKLRVGAATSQLGTMLNDERPEHRISAMWALRQIGWWKLLNEVGRLAREDTNVRVRRYAIALLRGLAEIAESQRKLQKAG